MQIDISHYRDELLQKGFVVINDIVNKQHLDILFEKMLPESYKLMEAETWGGVGCLKGHLQQNPPCYSPFVFRDILSNPIVIAISKSILGTHFYNDFYSANTNCPGSLMQPVHSDCSPLWEGNTVVHPPCSLVINVPLIDITEHNGSLEIWPGSHRVIGVEKFISQGILDQRKKITPPLRVNMQKGSVLIRDVRTWHCGMPNYSMTPRHMLAMIHRIHWLQRGPALSFANNCKADILSQDIEHHIYFRPDNAL